MRQGKRLGDFRCQILFDVKEQLQSNQSMVSNLPVGALPDLSAPLTSFEDQICAAVKL